MKFFLGACLLGCLMTFSGVALSEHPEFPFANSTQEHRFLELTKELRCLVCQNQSLADSKAGLADDLRKEVFRLLQQRASDQAIVDFLVQRYGEFVRYKPQIKPATYALWYGPAALLLLGALALFILIRRRAKTAVIAPCGPQAEQVRRLLDQD
ncbi:MAG: cytochrome c-type biogenesis protein [Gammaproteobacteria bacterium]